MTITEICIKYIIFLDLYLSCWVSFLGCFCQRLSVELDPLSAGEGCSKSAVGSFLRCPIILAFCVKVLKSIYFKVI